MVEKIEILGITCPSGEFLTQQKILANFVFFSCLFFFSDDEEEIIQAKCHYMRAEVDGHITYDLFDDAHVKVRFFF